MNLNYVSRSENLVAVRNVLVSTADKSGLDEFIPALLEINPEAKVIVSSGYSNDPVMADFKAYGFCATLSKPSRLTDFTDLINRFKDHDLSI